jgi:glycine/sarcosine N-methyltransferase
VAPRITSIGLTPGRLASSGFAMTEALADAKSKPSPKSVRQTDRYQAEYVQSFVEKWDELIDWKARAASEGGFFIELLRRLGKHKILDVATGTGFHSLQLLEAGFDVTSADGNAQMLAKAFENARRKDFILRTIKADWRWLTRDVHDKYDAVICLGNSFTHLFQERDRRRALAEFYSVLRSDGVLILDQRNYDSILDHGTKPKHTFYYCGDNVRAEPEYVDEGVARFRYTFPDRSLFHLNMFPLRKAYITRLLRQVGFQQVTSYGDFQETYQDTEPDFLVHLASKEYPDDGGR